MAEDQQPKIEDPHIVSRYDRELLALQQLVAEMGALVVEQVRQSVTALMTADVGAARHVIYLDKRVNHLDMEAKERVSALFAVRTPVAKDLRLVLSLHDVIDVLERTGDEAKGISAIVVRLFEQDRAPPTSEQMRDVTHMGQLAPVMLERALAALAGRDLESAVGVVRQDEEMNGEFRSALRRLATFLIEDVRNITHSIDLVIAFKSLERIGDYAKTIGEHVIYTIKGKDVRHMHPDSLSGGYLDT